MQLLVVSALIAGAWAQGCTYQGYLPPRGDSCDTYQGYPVCRCQTAMQDGSDIHGPLCDYPGGDVAVTSFVPVLGTEWNPSEDFGAGMWQLYNNGTVDGMSGKFKCCNVPNVDDCCPQFDTLVTKLDTLITDADAAYGAGCCSRTDALITDINTYFTTEKTAMETRMNPTMAKLDTLAAQASYATVHQYLFQYRGQTDEYELIPGFAPTNPDIKSLAIPVATGSEWKPADGHSYMSADRKTMHFIIEDDYHQCTLYHYEDDNVSNYPAVNLELVIDSGNNCDKLTASGHCAEISNVGTAATGLLKKWQTLVLRCYKTPNA